MRGDFLPKLVADIPRSQSRRLTRCLREFEPPNIVTVQKNFPIFWERAVGANVWDTDGNRYLDLTAGFGVANTGHSNRRVVDAGQRQLAKLPHGLGDVHPNELRLRLANLLSAITFERWGAGRGKVLFGCSGSDAVELALKTAAIVTGKPGAIAFEGAYHGLSYGALAVTWPAHYRAPFTKQLRPFVVHVPFPKDKNDLLTRTNSSAGRIAEVDKLLCEMEKTVRRKSIGAVILEPIQGRAGIIIPPKEFLQKVRQFCDTHSLLLIADEIYTGFGRTGKWFAVEHSFRAIRDTKFAKEIPIKGVPHQNAWPIPDLICVGKGMAGGFPISACIGRKQVMEAWPKSNGVPIHTSTFYGNPVGCAMALTQIEEIRSHQLVERSRICGRFFLELLQREMSGLRKVVEIRGRGLMIGIEIVKSNGQPDSRRAARIMTQALRRGIILTTDGASHNVVVLTPPLNISERQLRFAAKTLADVIKQNNNISRGGR